MNQSRLRTKNSWWPATKTSQTVMTTKNEPSATAAPHRIALQRDSIGPRLGPSSRASTGDLLSDCHLVCHFDGRTAFRSRSLRRQIAKDAHRVRREVRV